VFCSVRLVLEMGRYFAVYARCAASCSGRGEFDRLMEMGGHCAVCARCAHHVLVVASLTV
jgi:hypothetical protein